MWDNYTALTYNSISIPILALNLTEINSSGPIPKWDSHGTKSAHHPPYLVFSLPGNPPGRLCYKSPPAFSPSSLFLAFSFFSFCASHRELPSPPFVLCVEKCPSNFSALTATIPSRAKKLINIVTGPFIVCNFFFKTQKGRVGEW